MIRTARITTRTFLGIALVAGMATLAVTAFGTPAHAQSDVVAGAIANGTVGEQSDGYLGINGAVSGDVRAAVEALNIKRRAAYTELAAKRGVTVADMAAATGCQTLASRVKPGQAYRIAGGPWQVKGAGAINLPAYCATAG